MAWSRRLLSRSAQESFDIPSHVAAARPAVHDRLANPRIARTEPNRTATVAKLPARIANGPAAANAKPADTSHATPMETPDRKQAETPDTRKPEAPEKARTDTLDNARAGASGPGRAADSGAEMAEARQATELRPELDTSAGSLPRPIREQVVAAAVVAEQLTLAAIGLPERKQMSESSKEQASAGPKATEPAATTLVALLISRPEIEAVSDLAGKDVAIDDRQSASEASVRTALVAAGAAEVRLSSNETKAIDRLLGSEVPAAIVTLASAEAAAAFPDIAGFTVFRIALAPH